MNSNFESQAKKKKQYRCKKVRAATRYARLIRQIEQKRRLLQETLRAKEEAAKLVDMLKESVSYQFESRRKTEARYRLSGGLKTYTQLLMLGGRLLSSLEKLENLKDMIDYSYKKTNSFSRLLKQKLEEDDQKLTLGSV